MEEGGGGGRGGARGHRVKSVVGREEGMRGGGGKKTGGMRVKLI